MKRPNILWICTDQQRFDTLGCYGNPFVKTPHLDGLAQRGVLFESCFVQNPVCTPSRASFMTGRYPRATRCRQNGHGIPADEVLVTKMLADAGYTCGLSGKLHLSACHPSACPTMERRIDDGYHVFHWSHHPSGDWPTNGYSLWLKERGETFERRPFPDSPHIQLGMPEELHQTTWCVQRAINFVESNAGFARPWLFSVNPFDPHHPFDPPEKYLERYLSLIDEIPLPNYEEGELDNKPSFQKQDQAGAYNSRRSYPFLKMGERDHRLVRAAYWAMVDLIDAQTGRLLEALERTDQLNETIVIFTSDHGEMLGDHGFYLKGPHFYDPAIKVPLIISWPGRIAGGGRCRALVELTDLAPALLEALEMEPHPGMQGRSLWPLCLHPEEEHRRDVYCEYYNSLGCHRDPDAHATMLRTEEHKITVMHGIETGELYDLAADPKERENLWDSEEHQALKGKLLKSLCDRMAWTVDPLPLRESGY
jgi:arylsulfatase A-like enzyme